jgi:Uma2 family endonuclease
MIHEERYNTRYIILQEPLMSSIIDLPDVKPELILNDLDHYEIVDGKRVELSPMGAYQSALASSLVLILGHFAKAQGLGRVVVETLFQLDREGKLQRKPDVAFVSYQRWAKNLRIPDTNAWDVIPELAIEVNSPSNTANEILRKIHDYFTAGVLCVWVVYPVTEQIYVYSSPENAAILSKKDYWDGGTILPGFRFAVAQLFDTLAEEAQATNGVASS